MGDEVWGELQKENLRLQHENDQLKKDQQRSAGRT
jgi:hypothetical protein